MSDICDDNRFALIEKYKQRLIAETNIEDSPEEMAVIDSMLFRFWQMKWLDKLEKPHTDEEIQKIQDMEQEELDKAFELGRQEGFNAGFAHGYARGRERAQRPCRRMKDDTE